MGTGKRSETKIQNKIRETIFSLLKGKQKDLIVPQSYNHFIENIHEYFF